MIHVPGRLIYHSSSCCPARNTKPMVTRRCPVIVDTNASRVHVLFASDSIGGRSRTTPNFIRKICFFSGRLNYSNIALRPGHVCMHNRCTNHIKHDKGISYVQPSFMEGLGTTPRACHTWVWRASERSKNLPRCEDVNRGILALLSPVRSESTMKRHHEIDPTFRHLEPRAQSEIRVATHALMPYSGPDLAVTCGDLRSRKGGWVPK